MTELFTILTNVSCNIFGFTQVHPKGIWLFIKTHKNTSSTSAYTNKLLPSCTRHSTKPSLSDLLHNAFSYKPPKVHCVPWGCTGQPKYPFCLGGIITSGHAAGAARAVSRAQPLLNRWVKRWWLVGYMRSMDRVSRKNWRGPQRKTHLCLIEGFIGWFNSILLDNLPVFTLDHRKNTFFLQQLHTI